MTPKCRCASKTRYRPENHNSQEIRDLEISPDICRFGGGGCRCGCGVSESRVRGLVARGEAGCRPLSVGPRLTVAYATEQHPDEWDAWDRSARPARATRFDVTVPAGSEPPFVCRQELGTGVFENVLWHRVEGTANSGDITVPIHQARGKIHDIAGFKTTLWFEDVSVPSGNDNELTLNSSFNKLPDEEGKSFYKAKLFPSRSPSDFTLPRLNCKISTRSSPKGWMSATLRSLPLRAIP